jgi:hypothetical protein
MEVTAMNANDVKKELYKSKVTAKFSHYTSGNVYYTVELSDGVYQFPMLTTESGTLIAIKNMVEAKIFQLEDINEPGVIEIQNDIDTLNKELEKTIEAQKEIDVLNEKLKKATVIQNEIDTFNKELEKMVSLSSDLGTTSFYAEMKGSELNRWITKAINSNEFVKVN